MTQGNDNVLRVAIIGMGFMGCTHYRAFDRIDEAQVTVIADRNPAKARGDLTGVSGNVGGDLPTQLPMDSLRGTTDLHAPLHMDDVDIIDICLVTPLHVEFAVAALRAGKHVICEKPLATTVAQAKQITDAAAEATGYFMPAMCMRFWPQWAWLKQVVHEQRYGKALGATFRRVTSLPVGWFVDGEASGGAAIDLHIHDTDFVQHLFGMPRAVTSTGYTRSTGGIDHLATLYHYDDVPLVVAEGGWAFADGYGFTMQYTVNFERATADFDLARADEPLRLIEAGKATAIDCGPGDGWEGELRYFVDCVRRGRRPTVVDGPAALASMRIIEAECRSVRSGCTERV